MADKINIDNCRINHFPKAVLAEKAKPVDEINDHLFRLVDKMIDIMIEKKGVGLAAPQAGVGLRLFIISLDGSKENVRVFVNPIVTPKGKLITHEEGCLSVPGVYTKVKRYEKATVTATDLDGNEFTEHADGLYARALQHEYDHIEGITIADKMGTAAKIAHRRQLKKLIKNNSSDSSSF